MERIVVGYDGSEPAQRALGEAIRLARLYHAPLTVMTAAEERLVRPDGVETLAADEELAQWTAEQGAARARDAGVDRVETRIAVAHPADALIAACREGGPLLVVGHRGLGGLKEFFLGSVAKSVVDQATCSVLVVR